MIGIKNLIFFLIFFLISYNLQQWGTLSESGVLGGGGTTRQLEGANRKKKNRSKNRKKNSTGNGLKNIGNSNKSLF